jgi:hypothetical protein
MNKIRIAGAAAGVVLVSGIVLQVSSAAFTGTTENAGNEWEAGSVSLSDDDAGQAMYASVANISPGYSEKQCIEVEYTGSITPDTAIALYAATTSTPVGGGDGLADDLTVSIEIGPATSQCNLTKDALVDATGLAPALGTNLYSGALDGFNTSASPDPTGWTPDAEGAGVDLMRPFLFTVQLPAAADNDAQQDSATATFTWSATA